MALETWLRGKDLAGPMLGAQRRIEARIGQLLGDGDAAQKTGKPSPFTEKVSSADKARFRVLARGLQFGLPDETWRSPRESLVRLIQERYPMPRHVPPIVETSDGAVRKPRAERAREIKELAECGALERKGCPKFWKEKTGPDWPSFQRRARKAVRRPHREQAGRSKSTQIAETLGIGEQQVRNIAKECEIALIDAVIGRTRQLDTARILEETITGVGAYVDDALPLDPIGSNGESGRTAEIISKNLGVGKNTVQRAIKIQVPRRFLLFRPGLLGSGPFYGLRILLESLGYLLRHDVLNNAVALVDASMIFPQPTRRLRM